MILDERVVNSDSSGNRVANHILGRSYLVGLVKWPMIVWFRDSLSVWIKVFCRLDQLTPGYP